METYVYCEQILVLVHKNVCPICWGLKAVEVCVKRKEIDGLRLKL